MPEAPLPSRDPSMLIAFNKPYGVLCQFTDGDGRRTLADFIDVPGVYAAGRLDFDSEGLLLLTDDGALQHAIADPAHRLVKRYRAQVEGIATDADLASLVAGIDVGEGRDRYRARAVDARAIADPGFDDRDPPIRHRAHIPTSWIEIALSEGRNRQVRRMTAAAGLPTLRLVRVAIGEVSLAALALAPGRWMPIEPRALATDRTFAYSAPSTAARRRRYST